MEEAEKPLGSVVIVQGRDNVGWDQEVRRIYESALKLCRTHRTYRSKMWLRSGIAVAVA